MEKPTVKTKVSRRNVTSTRIARRSRTAWAEPALAFLIDDDGSDRRQLVGDLHSRGFSVEMSADVEDAVAAALDRRPALVVLELRMRRGDGLELLARLCPALLSTRFVVLTRYGSVASAVRAMRLGATNYLCKPATVAEVLRAAEQGASYDLDGSLGSATPAPTLTLDEAIWEYINRTLEDAGSLSEAARRLGLWRQSLKRMISKYRPPARRLAATSPPRMLHARIG